MNDFTNSEFTLKTIYLSHAIKEALRGVENKEGAPFGACIVFDNQIIALSHDTVLKDNDATCHAEINVIRLASKHLNAYRLENCEIFCTSEPCPMCLSAIHWSGIKACYFVAGSTLAATYGFDDKMLYDELSKPFSMRNIPVTQDNTLIKQVENVFKEWKKQDLPVC